MTRLAPANEEMTPPLIYGASAAENREAPRWVRLHPAPGPAYSGNEKQGGAATSQGDPDVDYLLRLRHAAARLERAGYPERAAATRRAISRLVDVMCGVAP